MSAEPSSHPRSKTLRDFQEMKSRGEKIVVLTAYDVLFARMLQDEGVDMILVGDSLGQVVLGYDSTLPVSLDAMIHHAAAVRRGAPDTFVVVDLPFMTYQVSLEDALRNAGRVLKETGAQAVKVEGADGRTLDTIIRMVEIGIPVMGHVGLTPQSIHALSGYRVQGRGPDRAERLRHAAVALEAAGCFSIVLELMPGRLAEDVSRTVGIPTIGIGAGAGCDGQVLVLPDALGLNPAFAPRFLRTFADLDGAARSGVRAYVEEVREGRFPGPEHTYTEDG